MKYEQSALTKLIAGALMDAIIHIRRAQNKGELVATHPWVLAIPQYDELLKRIENEKLDIRLVSREY